MMVGEQTAELRSDLRLALDRVAFAEKLGITPDPWQEDLLRSESKRQIMNIARQAGKSSMAAVLALHRALFYPNSLALVVGPALRQSQELFGKISEYHATLGQPLRKYGERKLSLELGNGSRIVCLPGSERTVRGFSAVSLLIVDEAARVEDALYYAVKPMLATSGGTLVLLSTPYGKRGSFYEEWEHGKGWDRYQVTAYEVPRITEEFLESERASMPDFVFRQEYGCEFIEAEDQVFAESWIQGALTDEVRLLDFAELEEGDEW